VSSVEKLNSALRLIEKLECISNGCYSIVRQIEESPENVSILKTLRIIAKSQAILADALHEVIKNNAKEPADDFLSSFGSLVGLKNK
jgi:hypothetical protein